MKQCPQCKTTYTDDSLKFCLTDGSPLEMLRDADKTIAFPDAKTIGMNVPEPTVRQRVDIGSQSPDNSVPTVFPAQRESSPGGSNKVIVGLLVTLIVLILAGFAGFAAYMWFSPKTSENAGANVSPTAVPSPTPNEAEELKKKLAELEKMIEEQRENQSSASTKVAKPTIENAGMTARANSPGDGFLALRSQPNTETGDRLAKIPHGAAITVIGCPRPTNPGKMRGKWCRVIYDGIEGWAFDAYMKFD